MGMYIYYYTNDLDRLRGRTVVQYICIYISCYPRSIPGMRYLYNLHRVRGRVLCNRPSLSDRRAAAPPRARSADEL